MIENIWIGYYNLAINNLKRNRISEAISNLLKSTSFSNKEISYNLLGLCLWRMGEIGAAKYFFNESLKINSNQENVNKYLVEIDEIIDSTKEYFDQINKLIIEEKYLDIYKILELKMKPFLGETINYNNYIGVICYLLDCKKDAINYWSKSLEYDSKNRNALLYLKEIHRLKVGILDRTKSKLNIENTITKLLKENY